MPRSTLLGLSLAGALFLATPAAAAVNHPFASHPLTYAAGSIKPSHVTQAVMDQAVRTFYDAWKDRFLEQACGAGRYVVLTHTQSGNLTVSEGHGYGMLLAALMAGHDPDAQTIFDGMYTYFKEHPTEYHANLMAWYQNNSCSSADGQDSASDGDLDIAYALLLADKQWGSCGAIDYLAAAQAVIADIKDGELDTTARYVTLGDWVMPSSGSYYTATRSSDFMPDHYRSFQTASGDSDWSGLLDRTYQIVSSLQTNHSPTTGLLPDFVRNPLGTPSPAAANFLEGPNDGAYSYNACRDPWRLATDFLVTGETRAKTAVQKINTWIRSSTGGDPDDIKSGYQLSGTMIPGSDYLSMAFVAPLGVGAMVDSSNQTWLNAVWDRMLATPLSAEGYYENTLKLLSMIVMSGNWWAPQSVSAGSCDTVGTPLCTGGAGVFDSRIDLRGLAASPGKQSIKWRATLVFAGGVPSGFPLDGGAQLLLEDLGSGGTSIFDLTAATKPIPSSSAGACNVRRDRWKVLSTSTTYRNGSTALDPPTCTLGSTRGLKSLRYKPDGPNDLRVDVQIQKATFSGPIVGPLRATVILGPTELAGQSGACGATTIACMPRGTGYRCE